MEAIDGATIYDTPAPHMVGDGFRVHNFFPQGYKLRMSPFYLMDYNSKLEFSPTKHQRGVGVHPHRGFETVTIAYRGAIAHHDSAGNSGIIYAGDVQWMTAGSGILHKEYHEEQFGLKGGIFQMVQLWVNLPAAFKMTKPNYQSLTNASIPKVEIEGGTVEVIAGSFGNTTGAASTFSPMDVYNLKLQCGHQINLRLKNGFNSGLLVVEGQVKLNDSGVAKADQFAKLSNDHIVIEAQEDSVILVLSGQPINEPIAQYGPFLMNKPEEIQQAIADYNEGRFGYLE